MPERKKGGTLESKAEQSLEGDLLPHSHGELICGGGKRDAGSFRESKRGSSGGKALS